MPPTPRDDSNTVASPLTDSLLFDSAKVNDHDRSAVNVRVAFRWAFPVLIRTYHTILLAS